MTTSFYYLAQGRETTKVLGNEDLTVGLRSKPFFTADSDDHFRLALLYTYNREPIEGERYWNSITKNYRYWDGSTWQNLGNPI